MDLSNYSYEALRNKLYDTLDNRTPWDAFIEALGDAVDAKSIYVLAIDKAIGALSYSAGSNLPSPGEMEYIQKFHMIDPRLQALMPLKTHEWFHCYKVFDDDYVSNSEFYQKFLLPLGWRYLSGCKVVDDDHAIIIMTYLRRPEQGPVQDEAVCFINRLLPLISRAFKADVKNFTYSTHALVGHALINRLRQPVILLTPTAKVVHINDAAKQLLSRTHLVAINNHQLEFPDEYGRKFIKECANLEGLTKKICLNDANIQPYKTLQIKSSSKAISESLFAFFIQC